MPYIYSEAWEVSKNGSTIMRPLVMDFKNDPLLPLHNLINTCLESPFLLHRLLNRELLNGMCIYQSQLRGITSGQENVLRGRTKFIQMYIKTGFLLFVKAGSIVPMGKFLQYTSEKPMDTLEIRIYPGADGQFTLYSDEGNNYNYEKGKYTVIPFKWNEQQQTLTIDKQQGSYAGALKRYVFIIVWVNESNGIGIEITKKTKAIIYAGEKVSVVKK